MAGVKGARVVMGWWVEGILDDDPQRIDSDGLAHEPLPRRLSRVFHVKQAADDFAALVRANVKRYPTSVTIRTKTGDDHIEGGGA